MKEKLKIGILLNKFVIPSWEYQILNEIKNSDYAKIVLVIRDKSTYPKAGKGGKKLTYAVVKFLERSDRIIFKRRFDYNLKKEASGLLKDSPVLDIDHEYSSEHENSYGKMIDKIINFELDIILKFGFHVLNGEILKVSKYGIWACSINEKDLINSITSGFWEVVRNNSVTNSALLILKVDTERKEVIYNSWESTCPFSINQNRNIVFWRASLFMPRIMNGLHKYGESYLNNLKKKFEGVNVNKNKLFQLPSFIDATRIILNYFVIATRTIFKKLFYTDAFNWQLLFDINKDNNSYLRDFGTFKRILSPRGIFWADPFVVAENDNYYIFVEEFIFKANKAHISVLKLDNKGNLLSFKRIIERPYHMSYPFVFRMNATYYMIPETSKNKTIELYKCTEFPYRWEFERNLMENISAVDTTLFYYDNKWWIFTSLDQTGNISGGNTELFLFFANDLFSDDWISHPDNPIVSDSRTARPAGKLFVHEGNLYRPSQDCSGRYGRGFNLNQVTRLTETEYNETLISKVEPIWDKKLKGTHTFNVDKDFTVIDVYSFRKRL